MWTKAQDREFAGALLAMGELFNEAVSQIRIEMFSQAVVDLPFEAIMLAARAHVRSSPFFPKPADLRARVEGNLEDQAALAWQHVLREVQRIGYFGTPTWPDAATQLAAEGLFGSWRALCERLPAGGPELLGYQKQFVALFAATRRHAATPLQLPPGREEARGALADITAQLATRKKEGS